jgi:large subunit ribosomal protein L5
MAPTQQRSRLKSRYEQEIRPALIERFQYTTPMQAPVIRKITLNMGVGDAKQDSKVLEAATEQLATIAGQRPNVRRARKSIAAFKLREGMPVGVSVTLRGERSYEFLDRLMSVAIPRIRDFRGLNPRSFDGRGNYSLGVREQIIFPEIDYDAIDQTRGLDITITTSARTDEEAFALLEAFGFPFARPEGVPGPSAGIASPPAPEADAEIAQADAEIVETAEEIVEQALIDDAAQAEAEEIAADAMIEEAAEELASEAVAEALVEEAVEELAEEIVAEALVEEAAEELAEEIVAEVLAEEAAEEIVAEEPAGVAEDDAAEPASAGAPETAEQDSSGEPEGHAELGAIEEPAAQSAEHHAAERGAQSKALPDDEAPAGQAAPDPDSDEPKDQE